MKLPNYFLADMAPDQPVDANVLREACRSDLLQP